MEKVYAPMDRVNGAGPQVYGIVNCPGPSMRGWRVEILYKRKGILFLI
jgi:hypothetical protein